MKSHTPINRRDALKAMGVGVTGWTLAQTVPAHAVEPQQDKLNVLLILTDQQHIDTLSTRGNPWLHTPAMDQLCDSGCCFQNSYSSNPVCSPARSSILTGRTSRETGVYKNGKPIISSIPNLGQWLGRFGYQSVYAGKWHLPGSFTTNIPGFRVLTAGVSNHGCIGDTSTSMACESFLHIQGRDKPFFLTCSIFQPHDICQWLRVNQSNRKNLQFSQLKQQLPKLPDNFAPYPQVEPAYVKRRRLQDEPFLGDWDRQHWRWYRYSYYRMIEQLDAEIGRVLLALRETGLDRNTVVILTSDHGEGLGHHQNVRKNRLYDESCRVPLILSLPGRIRPQVDTRSVVSGLDIVPTVCDLLQIPQPEGISHGVSLVPQLTCQMRMKRDYIVSEAAGNSRMVRDTRYKYITYAHDPAVQLFDTLKDPGETRNLAPEREYRDIVQSMREKLWIWEKRVTYAPNVPDEEKWPGVV